MADTAGTTIIHLSKEIEISIESPPSSGEYADVLEQLGLKVEEDEFVRWRTDCVAHPRNWGVSRKSFDTGLILMLDLFTYYSTSYFLSNH